MSGTNSTTQTSNSPNVIKRTMSINTLRTAANNVPNRAKNLRRSFKIVIMFFIVKLVFFFSWTPYWLFRFGVFDYNPLLGYSLFIRNCSNFFMYIALNKQFRKQVFKN